MEYRHQQHTKNWQQIQFILPEPGSTTILWITADYHKILHQQQKKFRSTFSNAKHFPLSLDKFEESTLSQFMREQLPKEAFENDCPSTFVHLLGLETHFMIGEDKARTGLISTMNFEREVLFGKFPFTIVIWSDLETQIKTQIQAPDFWDWLVNKFHFAGPELVVDLGKNWSNPDLPFHSKDQKEDYRNNAEKLLERIAVAQKPQDIYGFKIQLANTYIELSEWQKAMHIIDESLADKGSTDLLFRDSLMIAKAKILYYLRQFQKSIDLIDKLESMGNNKSYNDLIALVKIKTGSLMAFGRRDEAEKTLIAFERDTQSKIEKGKLSALFRDLFLVDMQHEWFQMGHVMKSQSYLRLMFQRNNHLFPSTPSHLLLVLYQIEMYQENWRSATAYLNRWIDSFQLKHSRLQRETAKKDLALCLAEIEKENAIWD